MRTLVFVTAALGAALTAAALAPAADAHGNGGHPHLRVMTYNIQHGAGEDGVFDLGRTAAAIAAQHPDVVGLQEVDDAWDARSDFADEATELGRALHLHAYFAEIYDSPPATPGAPDRRYGLAILSRYRIEDAQNHQITRLSTQVANPTPAPAPGFPEVSITVRGERVHVYDTHLDYRADPAIRRLQVTDTLNYLNNDPAPKILVGDLNATPRSPELAPLLAAQTDVWAQLGAEHPPSYPSAVPTDAIDFITVSGGITATSAAVVDTQASDHRPEVADLTLP